MEVVLVGAGNLATNLAHALREAGHTIPAVFSRTIQSATRLATAVGALPIDSIDGIPTNPDLCIVAVKDDVIQQVTEQLASHLPGVLIAHTAGTVPMEAVKAGRRGVFYPMQTFSKQRIVDFDEIPIFIEAGTEDDLRLLETLAASLSKTVMCIDSDRRKVLHLAAVFCCNFANHCSAIAEQILCESGIPFTVMLPLVMETTEKLRHCSPKVAQTGPAVRNDTTVTNRHLQLLREAGHDDFASLYEVLTASIHRLHGIPD